MKPTKIALAVRLAFRGPPPAQGGSLAELYAVLAWRMGGPWYWINEARWGRT